MPFLMGDEAWLSRRPYVLPFRFLIVRGAVSGVPWGVLCCT